jgi:transposase
MECSTRQLVMACIACASSIKDFSSLVSVGWDMIKEIQKKHLKVNYKNPNLTNVRRIVIDEIAVGKGHNYYTVILDLDTGEIMFMNKGKGHKSLRPFYQSVKRNKI